MTIKYYGQLKDSVQNTRVAEIGFNSSEEILINRILDLMEKTTAWKLAGMFENSCLISMDDRSDYKDFKTWYKEAKQTFKLCMKYGF